MDNGKKKKKNSHKQKAVQIKHYYGKRKKEKSLKRTIARNNDIIVQG